LVLLQSTLDSILSPLQNAHLNNSPHFGMSPTSENVCVWLWVRWQKELPGSPLQRISIALCDLEGRAMGQASLGR
jgi:6-pyruvoyl-tetrahydropterin synthase